MGVRLLTLPIAAPFEGFLDTLADTFAGRAVDTTEENLQSRIRGAMLMALSNKFGGLLLTAWALRRSGMKRRVVADKTLSFLILTYLVYMIALIVCGIGLYTGLLDGPNTFSLTLLPAVIALILTVLGLSIAFVPTVVSVQRAPSVNPRSSARSRNRAEPSRQRTTPSGSVTTSRNRDASATLPSTWRS